MDTGEAHTGTDREDLPAGPSGAAALLTGMTRRTTVRVGQGLVVVAAACLLVTLIGSSIARQSYRRIEAKEAVLREMGIEPWVPASHFLERSVRQNLAAGAFFGVTAGVAAGIGILFLVLLCESLPYRRFRIAATVLVFAAAAPLSWLVFPVEGVLAILLVCVLPAAVGAASQLVSPTPVWRGGDGGEPAAAPARGRYTHLVITLNVLAALGFLLWGYRVATALGASTSQRDFFVSFRDNVLMDCRVGRALDRFYYNNTPYASEYAPPTHFQPVCIVAAGVGRADSMLAPASYGKLLIPVYVMPVSGLDEAALRLAGGEFDVLMVDSRGVGMTDEQVEQGLSSRTDLPGNWRARTIILSGEEKPGPPVRVPKLRGRVSKAVREALAAGENGGQAWAIRNVIWYGFLVPLRSMLLGSAILLGFLFLVLWISIVATACASRGTARRATWIVLSALFALAGWGVFVTGPPDAGIKKAFARFEGKKRMPAEDIAKMLQDPSPSFRYAALCYLVRRPDPMQAKRALELFGDSDELVRMTAVEYLRKIPRAYFAEKGPLHGIREEIAQKVLAALDDESLHVRCRATEVIAALKLREGEDRLVKLVEENRDLYVTWYAIRALYGLRPGRKGSR
jgi:hypothetical protein